MHLQSVSDAPVEDRQSCRRCGGLRIQAVMMTTMVVYLRCEDCGEIWSIPQRREQHRTGQTCRILSSSPPFSRRARQPPPE
jgi:uncharacterized Zn finger protein